MIACMAASNNTVQQPANFTSPMQTSQFYAARCGAGWHAADVMKNAEFLSECFISQSSKPNKLIFNTMFYDIA